jgi:hypothetical protein
MKIEGSVYEKKAVCIYGIERLRRRKTTISLRQIEIGFEK